MEIELKKACFILHVYMCMKTSHAHNKHTCISLFEIGGCYHIFMKRKTSGVFQEPYHLKRLCLNAMT